MRADHFSRFTRLDVLNGNRGRTSSPDFLRSQRLPSFQHLSVSAFQRFSCLPPPLPRHSNFCFLLSAFRFLPSRPPALHSLFVPSITNYQLPTTNAPFRFMVALHAKSPMPAPPSLHYSTTPLNLPPYLYGLDRKCPTLFRN